MWVQQIQEEISPSDTILSKDVMSFLRESWECTSCRNLYHRTKSRENILTNKIFNNKIGLIVDELRNKCRFLHPDLVLQVESAQGQHDQLNLVSF